MLLTKIMRLTITSICSFLEFFGRQVLHEAKKEACAGRPLLCCCLVAKSCPTLCDSMDCTPPGSSVLHYLLKFARVDGVIQPSHPLHCVEWLIPVPTILGSWRLAPSFSNKPQLLPTPPTALAPQKTEFGMGTGVLPHPGDIRTVGDTGPQSSRFLPPFPFQLWISAAARLSSRHKEPSKPSLVEDVMNCWAVKTLVAKTTTAQRAPLCLPLA